MTRPSHLRRPGAAAIETALTMLPLLLFLLGVLEYSRLQCARHQMNLAAREGARYASVGKRSLTPADIQQRVQQTFGTLPPAGLTVQVYKADALGQPAGDWTTCEVGDRLAVRLDAGYQPLLPTFGILPNPIPLHAVACLNNEVP